MRKDDGGRTALLRDLRQNLRRETLPASACEPARRGGLFEVREPRTLDAAASGFSAGGRSWSLSKMSPSAMLPRRSCPCRFRRPILKTRNSNAALLVVFGILIGLALVAVDPASGMVSETCSTFDLSGRSEAMSASNEARHEAEGLKYGAAETRTLRKHWSFHTPA